jgi:hypothetical protein
VQIVKVKKSSIGNVFNDRQMPSVGSIVPNVELVIVHLCILANLQKETSGRREVLFSVGGSIPT